MSHFWHMSFHQSPDMPEALIQGRERMYLTWFYKKFAYDKSSITNEAIDEFARCYSAPGGLRASLAHYRAMPESARIISELAQTKLTIPCIAYGGRSCLADWPLKLLRQVARKVEGGIIDNCGHWVSEERPEWLTETLCEFFSRQ
jgi:pimeloyl-ACP methyl ester carboxylesterase